MDCLGNCYNVAVRVDMEKQMMSVDLSKGVMFVGDMISVEVEGN